MQSLHASLNNTPRVWMAGVPGSKWSGIHLLLHTLTDYFDNSDVADDTVYYHKLARTVETTYTGHKGYYWGQTNGTEHWQDITHLTPNSLISDISSVYKNNKIPIIRNHCFLRHNSLDYIAENFKGDTILLVWRKTDHALKWWNNIMQWDNAYPDYRKIYDRERFAEQVEQENNYLVDFAHRHGAVFEDYNNDWWFNHLDGVNTDDPMSCVFYDPSSVKLATIKI